ncbi:ectonucleoside triphosphate diphosphohydrolase 1-like [Argonauta hians]
MGCSEFTRHCNRWWYFVVVGFVVGSVGLITVSILWQEQKTHLKYSVVFDAGSSHTSLYIYTWKGSKTNGTAVVKQKQEFKTKAKGIHHYSADPTEAGQTMMPYLDYARDHIPDDRIASTPIYLGATAGMRLLRSTNQSASDAILTSIRGIFKASGFLFNQPEHQVRILTGSEEGTFSWITANYLQGYLGLNFDSPIPYLLDNSAPLTYGALDMGGASTQISFVPAIDVKMPSNTSFTLKLYGHPFTVYTHSFLCYGINEINRRFKTKLILDQSRNISPAPETIRNPCWLNGTNANDTKTNLFQHPCAVIDPSIKVAESFQFIGTGELEKCQQKTNDLFNFKDCPFGHSCSFNKVYLPPITGKEFYAFSTFYYLTFSLNLTKDNDSFSLEDYTNATKYWCNQPWDKAPAVPGLDISILREVCFEAVYIKTILTKGYHFNSSTWQSLHFRKKVSGTDVGWALGFMLYTSNEIPNESLNLGKVTFISLVALFIIFILLSVVFAWVAKRETAPVHAYQTSPSYGSTDTA